MLHFVLIIFVYLRYNIDYQLNIIMTKEEIKYLKATGYSIHAKRKDLGITQEELAKKIEISRNHISRIEKGLHPVNIITLRRIANELNCTVAELIGENI